MEMNLKLTLCRYGIKCSVLVDAVNHAVGYTLIHRSSLSNFFAGNRGLTLEQRYAISLVLKRAFQLPAKDVRAISDLRNLRPVQLVGEGQKLRFH